MRSFVFLTIIALALAGTATATNDGAGTDQTGRTPACTADQSDSLSDRTRGQPVRACEGEHWEGNDPINGDGNPDQVGTTVAFRNSGNGNLDGGPGANDGDDTDTVSTDELLGVRVSAGAGQAYVSAQIGGVGSAAVFTSGTMTAVFLQDYSENSAGCAIASPTQECNGLASIVNRVGITRGVVGEEDANDPSCTVDGYQTSGVCKRDNTAATVDLRP